MKNDKRADAAKVFLDLLARSPEWMAARGLGSRSAAFVTKGGPLTWQRLGQGGAQA